MAIPTFDWRGERPADADEWERIVRDEVHDPVGGLEVVIERVPNGWRVLTAPSGGYGIGTGPLVPVPVPRTDERERVTRALRDAGKPVMD
jgi:hypothetical protein